MKINFRQLVIATALSSIAVSVFVALITISGEEYVPLKAWLKDTFTHHWIGKSVLSVVLFICSSAVCYFLPLKNIGLSTSIIWASVMAILSAVAMTGYFILHTLHFV